MSETDDEFLTRLRAAFRDEAAEHLRAIAAGLLALEGAGRGDDDDPARRRDALAGIFREAHSLKGAARAVDSPEAEAICKVLESVLAAWKRRDVAPAPAMLDPLHRAVNVLERIVPSVGDGSADGPPDGDIPGLLDELQRL